MNETIEFDKTKFMMNAKGNLVPISKVKDIDKIRDEKVREWFALAKKLREQTIEIKHMIFDELNEFCELSASDYDTIYGGKKGNTDLTTFDGSIKIVKQVSDVMTVDERINIAKHLIDECIMLWSEDANDNVKAIINLAFKVDKKGNLSISRLRQLLALDINDEKWLQAMKAINESIKVVDTCEYMRFYIRDDEQGKYQAMPMDFASA